MKVRPGKGESLEEIVARSRKIVEETEGNLNKLRNDVCSEVNLRLKQLKSYWRRRAIRWEVKLSEGLYFMLQRMRKFSFRE